MVCPPPIGKGTVFICLRAQLFRHKFVPWHGGHGGKHSGILNAAPAQLPFDHFRALRCVLFAFKH